MSPDKIEGLPPGSGGPQDTVLLAANSAPITQNADGAQEPVDRRTSLTGLSVAVRDVRIRLALDDIWHALSPISRHSEATMLCVECEDIAGLEHHLRRVVDGIRKAAQKRAELKALLAEHRREVRQ